MGCCIETKELEAAVQRLEGAFKGHMDRHHSQLICRCPGPCPNDCTDEKQTLEDMTRRVNVIAGDLEKT